MGVDYLTCNVCEENFPDAGHFVRCWTCGTTWCSDSCAEEDGFNISEPPENWDEETDGDWEDHERSRTCNYCRGEDHPDYVLMDFALKLLKMNRTELVELYNKNKKRN